MPVRSIVLIPSLISPLAVLVVLGFLSDVVMMVGSIVLVIIVQHVVVIYVNTSACAVI